MSSEYFPNSNFALKSLICFKIIPVHYSQVGKEMLNPSNKNKDGETSSFNLLMELLRGDH